MADPGPPPEHVEWDAFLARFDWRQGEHVSMIGPTGAGKTTLALAILELRSFVVALATKPKDPTMDKLIKHDGYKLWRSWDDVPAVAMRRTMRGVLWPRYVEPADVANQQRVIAEAIRRAFTEGSWTIFADELWYLSNVLKLQPLLEAVYTQGRSLKLSLVGGTQRPAHVSLLAYDQATHLFFWRDNDENNLKRIGNLGGLHAGRIKATVAGLARHDVLYLNTRTGALIVTRAPHRK